MNRENSPDFRLGKVQLFPVSVTPQNLRIPQAPVPVPVPAIAKRLALTGSRLGRYAETRLSPGFQRGRGGPGHQCRDIVPGTPGRLYPDFRNISIKEKSRMVHIGPNPYPIQNLFECRYIIECIQDNGNNPGEQYDHPIHRNRPRPCTI